MGLTITFKDKQTGKETSGNVEWDDTIQGIINDLIEEGIIIDSNVSFEKEDGSKIGMQEMIQNIGLNDYDTIIVVADDLQKPKEKSIDRKRTTGVDDPERKRKIRRTSPQTFHQLGIIVLDGSGSMNDPLPGYTSKKEAVNKATIDLLSKFKGSRSVNNFSFSVVFFDEDATQKLPITKLIEIDENEDFDPTVGHNMGTLVYTGLEEAEKMANMFLTGITPGDIPHTVVMVLLSDGDCHEPDKTIEIANRIKKNPSIKVCTTFFGAEDSSIPEAEDLMKKVASTTYDFSKTHDSQTLRDFFDRSLSRIV